MEDDTHDLLVKTYLEYFAVNEKFERKNSVRTHRAVRKCLRQIRELAKIRMEEIHKKHAIKKQNKGKDI